MPASYTGNLAGVTARQDVVISNPLDGEAANAASNDVAPKYLANVLQYLSKKAGLIDVASTWTAIQTFNAAHVWTVLQEFAVGVKGVINHATTAAVEAVQNGAGPAMKATAGAGAAVEGTSTSGRGGKFASTSGRAVEGISSSDTGVHGEGATYGGYFAAKSGSNAPGMRCVGDGTGVGGRSVPGAGSNTAHEMYGYVDMGGGPMPTATLDLGENLISRGLMCRGWARVRCNLGVLTLMGGQNVFDYTSAGAFLSIKFNPNFTDVNACIAIGNTSNGYYIVKTATVTSGGHTMVQVNLKDDAGAVPLIDDLVNIDVQIALFGMD
jgi:hypothetical protein